MAFTLDKVVPWGRSFDEYIRMFKLTGDDISSRILGCADGPSSFNVEATKRGYRVISSDPIYNFSAEEIKRRIEETYDRIIGELHKNLKDYVWETFSSPEELGKVRMSVMHRFLEDYQSGKTEGRYIEASLPELPFQDKEFDIAICSHFLFTYSEQLPLDFHRKAVAELCRVSREVRIFPLLDLGGRKSVFVKPIETELRKSGYRVAFLKVPYEFQKGSDTVMRIY